MGVENCARATKANSDGNHAATTALRQMEFAQTLLDNPIKLNPRNRLLRVGKRRGGYVRRPSMMFLTIKTRTNALPTTTQQRMKFSRTRCGVISIRLW